MSEDVRLLTYDEIASAFGITRESARQLVIRKRWSRLKGNDNKARIEVPEDAFQSPRTSDDPSQHTGNDTPSAPSDSTSDDPSDEASVVVVLTRHIERLERDLATTQSRLDSLAAERDHERAEKELERARAVQVDILKAVLEAEQRRSTELKDERDRWQQAATAPRGFWAWMRRAG